MTLEVIQFLGAREDPGRKTFLDDDRAAAVLRFVHLRVTLALLFDERPKGRRPMQNGRVGKMKNIVEAISVRIEDVVGQRIADKNAVQAQVAASAAALIHRDLEMRGKLLFLWKVVIERWKARIVGREKTASGLGDILANHFRESDTGCLERPQIRVGKCRELGSCVIRVMSEGQRDRPPLLPAEEARRRVREP